MPKLTQALELADTLELTEEQRTLLMRELRIYEALQKEKEDAERDLAVSKSVLDGLREELGVRSISPAENYIITRVDGGTSSSLDKKALMKAFKITPRQWEGFIRHKPKKAYTLVTTPRDKKKADEKAAKAKLARPARDDRDDYDERDE